MKQQLRSKVSGTVLDIIAETDDWWWAMREDDAPHSIPKDTFNWELYTRVPAVGDVWQSVGLGALYRVLGVDEPNKLAHWVKADAFHDGSYPTIRPGGVQIDAAPKVVVFTREFPEEYLTFVENAS
jgi:hypothetical protein